MSKNLQSILRIAALLLLPLATLLSLHLNIITRPIFQDLVFATNPHVLFLQSFAINHFVYLLALFITLYFFFVKETKINLALSATLAVVTALFAISLLTWLLPGWSERNAIIFTFLFQFFFDLQKTLVFLSINFIVYLLLILRALHDRKPTSS